MHPPYDGRVRRLLSLIVIIALSAACVNRPGPDASGREVYLDVCARCHGSDLNGGIGPALGPDSVAAGQADEFLVTAIVDGRGRMPSFRQTLSSEHIERLVEYIRAVQAGS